MCADGHQTKISYIAPATLTGRHDLSGELAEAREHRPLIDTRDLLPRM